MQDLKSDEIIRWFKRGVTLLEAETQVESMLWRIHSLEVYARRWMRVDPSRLAHGERQPERVISLNFNGDDREEANLDFYPDTC